MDDWSRTGFIRNLFIPDFFRKIPKADFIFISADADKSEVINGKHFDRILDPIYIELASHGYTCLNIARPYSRLSKSDTWNYTYTFNTKISLASLFDFIFKSLNFEPRFFVIHAYKKYLRRIQPRAVFCIGVHSDLCVAARDFEIPIVEVLHGIGYVKVFENWSDREKSQLPTFVLSFDDISSSTFKKFGKGVFQVIQTFPLWNKDFLKNISQQNVQLRKDKKPSVLFSLNWGYSGDHGDMTEFEGVIPNGLIPEEVLKAVEMTQETANWHFRLHPVQKSKNYYKVREDLSNLLAPFPNAEWEKSSEEPLPFLLEHISHHITMISMTSYEAAQEKIPTIMLCPSLLVGGKNQNMFIDLRDEGMALTGTFQPTEIVEWVLNSNLESSRNVPKTKTKTKTKTKSITIIELITELTKS